VAPCGWRFSREFRVRGSLPGVEIPIWMLLEIPRQGRDLPNGNAISQNQELQTELGKS